MDPGIYLLTDDIDDFYQRIGESNGKIRVEKTKIFGRRTLPLTIARM